MKAPLTLGFLLFDGFPMACLTSAIEPLRAANEITGSRAFAWRLLGETRAPVRSSADVRFEPDVTLAEAAPDILFLLSPPDGRFLDPRATAARLRWLDRRGVTLGAVSGGIFPLARAGLMAGHRGSVHWCYAAAFRAEFPAITASETVITRDRRRLTAAGAGAAFDLMLKLIEDRLGAAVMTEVACWFQHPLVRDEAVRQKTPVPDTDTTDDMLPATIRRAIRMFADHIEDPVQIGDVAQAVDLSARHLERGFRQATGESPLKYYRRMRLKHARQRVLYSDATLTEIAHSVGYASSSPMVRHYQAEFGVNPSEDRRMTQAFRVSGAAKPV
jgi:AraC family transcriptional regulator, glycine betaine-responsive activator